MFSKILVANRGEIACRVIRSANKLGIKTVAVYSEADAAARHVSMADEAVAIGAAPASQSYLVIENIIQAALNTGAEAIHPGYGFLSENAAFASACEDNDIVFIGPPVSAIEAMGSKSRAKQIMGDAGVPLVPGYHGDEQADEFLKSEAEKIGYPVLIKASAGGGGKGMRIVESADLFDEGLSAARREAMASFADDHVLIEKYLVKPRHIEIQVFCDNNGNAVYLFERDCSIQRRHQKVIEEAPAPGMQETRRKEMGDAAIAAALAIDYVGAGTVEFIVDADGTFYFMEMNTRLQVEHPVTELISGEDLVEWQFRVAFGEKLPKRQQELRINGHALEARIYAEDPDRDFLPATGLLAHLRFPRDNQHVRIDTGVREGDTVSMHYDPMIAKLIVWDHDREACIRRMGNALAETQVVGVTTNIDFLYSLVTHPAFKEVDLDTGFIERHHEHLFPETVRVSENILALATLYVLLERNTNAAAKARTTTDPHSPWHSMNSWRTNLSCVEEVVLEDNENQHKVLVQYVGANFELKIAGQKMVINGSLDQAGEMSATIDGTRTHVTVVKRNSDITLLHSGKSYQLKIVNMGEVSAEDEASSGSLSSPMPGKIVQVLVSEEDKVTKGDALLILEAMKMEHTITAPENGVISKLHYHEGDMIDEGVELLVLDNRDDQ